ncbi:MAG: type IV pilin [Halorhabdus sp.]
MTDRAQSEVTGTVLLLAVVVIIVVIAGVFILSTIDTQDEPVANLEVTIDDSNVTLSHHGGRTLATDEVTVILRSGTETRQALTTFVEQQGNGDDVFEPGERLTRVHNATDSVRVLVVHDPSNTILSDREYDVPTP